MYPTLFQLAGLAMAGWALLILLPGWRVTRWLAETAVFPVYLGVIYVVGVLPLVVAAGPGIMADFGNVDGVLGLLRDPDVALIAWIHILAFDHLIGVLIYRDNMRHRFVPLPVQSVILFFTLMFGPVGFVSYYVIRVLRRRRPRVGLDLDVGAPAARGDEVPAGPAGSPDLSGDDAPRPPSPGQAAPRTAADVVRLAGSALARERLLTGVGAAGLAVTALCLLAVAVRGPFIPPEGKMLDAATFTLGVAIFTLTVALLLPLAGFSEPARRRYAWLYAVFPAYAFVIEPVQAFRGLDPRFTAAGGAVDQIAGVFFGLTALLVTVMFVVLAIRFFRRDVLRHRSALRLGIRYGGAAVGVSFAVGIVMSFAGGRVLGPAGNLLPAHGLGVHGIQALPAVALLGIWAGAGAGRRAAAWIHAAGIGWLAACIAALAQAVLGRPPLEPALLPSVMVAGVTLWAAVAGYAFYAWRRAAGPAATAPVYELGRG